jgi:hypothetical protein
MWLVAFLPFWYVFTAPGKFILWRNFMFPGHGVGPWYSGRQKDSKIILVYLSLRFWFWWVILGFFGSGLALLALKAVTYGPGGLDLSPFWTVWYGRLNGSWIANLSFDTIIYIIRTVHYWFYELAGQTLPDPTWQWHPGPILPAPVVPPLPGQPANLNQFLNQN